MIRHIVMFGARSPDLIDEIVETLSGYREIEAVGSIEVRRNDRLDGASREVDVVLHATFADRAALERYKADPIYAAGTRRVRPLRTIRHVADYEV
jgi:hypothetical protein